MRLTSVEGLRDLREVLTDSDDVGLPRIVICAGTACQAGGCNDIMRVAKRHIMENSLRDKIKLRITGCHGLCEEGPFILTEPQNAFYGKLTLEDIPRIIDATLKKKYVKELLYTDPKTGIQYDNRDDIPFFKNQTRTIMDSNQKVDPIRIHDYIGNGGYTALETVLDKNDPKWTVEEVKKSGLRGRGGAGFPTGFKWQLLSDQKGNKGKFLVCNADEGDPGAYMDGCLLEGNPHSIIEGMIIGAFATGANEGIVYVRKEYPFAIKHLTIALRQAQDLQILGDNILGTGFSFNISIVRGAGAFVCGEETALIHSIEGKMGEPKQRPPFPVQKGIYGRPTAINNVETWANINVIFKLGAENFAKVGTENNSGTKIFSLVGKVRNTGLVEVPMGTPIGEVVTDIGGGVIGDAKIKAIQTGGPSGGCVPVHMFNLPVDYDTLREAGSMMGSGGMIVIDDKTCIVDVTKYYMNFLKDESCGKCYTCRKGTQRMYELLDDVTQGVATLDTLSLLEELAYVVKDTTMCGLGQSASNPVLSTLRHFRHEYEAHIIDKRCPAAVCEALFVSPCQHSCPIGTDVPTYVGLIKEKRVDDAYKVLADTNPFPSVCGRVCGHPCESKCRRGNQDEPVAIMHLKRFITDKAKKSKVKKVKVTRNEKIAIIGAGPSGLTAALDLRKRGYEVTVFEELPEAGGMLRYGIPEYRLPREILDEEIQRILDTGVSLKTDVKIGKDISFDELAAEYEKVYVAIGAHTSLKLKIKGENSKGVFGAVEWLREHNLGNKVKTGKKVAIIGGGNSALDAARTALRSGGKSVSIYYRREEKDMPALASEIAAARAEGIKIETLTNPTSIKTKEGKVCGLRLTRNKLEGFDKGGRKKPVPIKGSEFTVEMDTIISAISQKPEMEFIHGESNIDHSEWNIEVDKNLHTSNKDIWAGGDATTGPGWAIDAIQMGHQAADEIDKAIRKTNNEEPWKQPKPKTYKVPFDPNKETKPGTQPVMPTLEPKTRKKNFEEVEVGYNAKTAAKEASRCIRCDYGSCNK